MQLKDFQQEVLDGFDKYLDQLVSERSRAATLEKLNQEQPELDIPIPDYSEEAWNTLRDLNVLPESRADIPYHSRTDCMGQSVPSITFKIPTAGGKTILAVSAVSRIMSKWLRRNYGLVLWIVPSESIYSQTYKTLNNREHPYRQALDRAAAGKVKILEKMSPLDRRDVESHLCIILLMLQSSNRQNKETLKIFKDRGNVHGFFPDADDFQGHYDVLDRIHNLDVYRDKESFGCLIKDSLSNALRIMRPVVVMDEGHKVYSKLARETLYGFNPCFVLELSATPADRPNYKPPVYSNWLVDVRGIALDKEEMIKLPINVIVRNDGDWQDCLRESLEHLDMLQDRADTLRAESQRYIRPICLVQVERTGKEQRKPGFIHAEDARDYLLTLGVREQQIAIKTSDRNDLKEPENLDLLSPTNQIRFIITKQALQEGWDCPFAYVLCSLAPMINQSAMTQLVGRILRQPDTAKTGVSALDECYVFCFHAVTRDVVEIIKKGLEQDGMSDLTNRIKQSEENINGSTSLRTIRRRNSFRNLEIYLPQVNWTEDGNVRPLDYEQDILYRVEWDQVSLAGIGEQIPEFASASEYGTQSVRVALASDPNAEDLVELEELDRSRLQTTFDPLYVVRSVSDIVPNAWITRDYIKEVIRQLGARDIKGYRLTGLGHLILEIMRERLIKERDRLAEIIFMEDVEAGRIQFRLRADSHNWKMPDEIMTQRESNSQRLRREDGYMVQKDLFDATYLDSLNKYERNVACYLDGEDAIRWWHRNIAQKQYALQGWKKSKIYPDFIFAMNFDGNERIMILEAKGNHLDNPDTLYKKQVLEICKNAFISENISSHGELELVLDGKTTVSCALMFEGQWQVELSKLLSQ